MDVLKLMGARTEVLRTLEKAGVSPTRRKLLFGGAAGLAAFWDSIAAACPPNIDTPTNQPIRWLVNRATFGLTPAELADATTRGFTGYLEYQLDYASIDDSALDTRISTTYPHLADSADSMASAQPPSTKTDLIEATILRSVLSRRQLYQRMVEFWTDHFNIDINQDNQQWLKVVDDRDVIRTNALGNFGTLLMASAQSPAMMFYLNNNLNVASAPNENYARELMELHTVSVNGGYTQTDVHEVARCFTGWSLYGTGQGTNSWHFRYIPGNHDTASKTVLGNVIPARTASAGMQDGLDVLNILINHPNTANFIATKLCKRFWGESPPNSLITAVAATYSNNGSGVVGDIKAMLRTLFNSTDPMTVPFKYKRPYHLACSALRVAGATINTLGSIRSGTQYGLGAMGQTPFYWSPPDGYPDTIDAWVGLIQPRWNFAFQLGLCNTTGTGTSGITGVTFSADTWLNSQTLAGPILDAIENKMYGALGIMPAGERSRLQSFLPGGTTTSTNRKDVVGLALSSPSFQWH